MNEYHYRITLNILELKNPNYPKQEIDKLIKRIENDMNGLESELAALHAENERLTKENEDIKKSEKEQFDLRMEAIEGGQLERDEVNRLKELLAQYRKPCEECGGKGYKILCGVDCPDSTRRCPCSKVIKEDCPTCNGTGTILRWVLPDAFMLNFRLMAIQHEVKEICEVHKDYMLFGSYKFTRISNTLWEFTEAKGE